MSEPTIINLSGYRFVPLADPASIQSQLKSGLNEIGVRGAVLLASEGINVNLAGDRTQANAATALLNSYQPFKDLWLKESLSDFIPHKRLRVRVRSEIIAFDGHDSAQRVSMRPVAPQISPQQLDSWLQEQRDITLLDTRNDYEIESGTFERATHLDIKHFKHFKQAVTQALEQGTLDKSKPMITFCTGGIRCEKAAPWLLSEGFEEVYQIEGGVINYLQCSEATHWRGECFVFDDRVELNTALKPTGAGLCDYCQLAVPQGTECQCQLGPHYHATYSKP